MTDSIFVLLDSKDLPTEQSVVKRYAQLSEGAELDSDWTWQSLEGWLPSTYLGDESGFEAICDEISGESNSEFLIIERPELDFLVELTPRGGPDVYGCALTFAAAAALSGNGTIEVDEGTRIDSAQVEAWYSREILAVKNSIEKTRQEEEKKQQLIGSGLSPELLLDAALKKLIGQKIIFVGSLTMFRTEDESTISGACCELWDGGNIVATHGHYATLRDNQSQMLRELMPNLTEQDVARIEAIDEQVPEAKSMDEKAQSITREVVKNWPGQVSIAGIERTPDNDVLVNLSNGFSMKFDTRDNFSMLNVHTGGIHLVLNGTKISMK